MLKEYYAELLGLDLENNKNSEWLDLSINEVSKYGYDYDVVKS